MQSTIRLALAVALLLLLVLYLLLKINPHVNEYRNAVLVFANMG